jgi:aspartate carbamoyltransferase catalytic subunit
MKHLLNIDQLSKADCQALLTHANAYLLPDEAELQREVTPVLADQIVATLFFEPSTRTRISFTVAAYRLGAKVIDLNAMSSSLQKGETVTDTVVNLAAMGVNAFVMRHREPGLPGRVAAAMTRGHVINAGEGCHQHPTQALLDALTLQRHCRPFKNLSVAIVGDVVHSRVARSEVALLNLLGVQDIRLVVPSVLSPHAPWPGTVLVHALEAGLQDVDVIIVLRGQVERMSTSVRAQFEEVSPQFVLTQPALMAAKSDVVIMHPGPVNSGDEIAHEVLQDPRCMILAQVTYGVAMRMAILSQLLNT